MTIDDLYSDEFTSLFKKSIYEGLIYSVFDDEGPTPKFSYPDDLDFAWQLQIAMKSISLMMGERTYQDGEELEEVRYFGLLPFPDFGLNALTFFFLIEDEEARGSAKAATITVLVPEKAKNFFYENMKYFRVALDETAAKIDNDTTREEVQDILAGLIEDLVKYSLDSSVTYSANRRVKVLFTGLDNSGKSSTLLAVKKKYSELMGIRPTRQVTRTQTKLFGTLISEWDLPGQGAYREAYLRQSEVYLYDVDVIYYVVDARDAERINETVEYFNKVLNSLRMFDQHPPIVVCLHKVDPDLEGEDLKKVKGNTSLLERLFKVKAQDFNLKFFETSVFDSWSLISAFSYGISRLSPNREVFRVQLEWLAKKLGAHAVLLLNENALVISDYAEDEVAGKVFEMSAPHFQSLYRTFKEFRLMEKDRAHWKMEGSAIFYEKLAVGAYSLYLMIWGDEERKLEKLPDFLDEFVGRISGLIEAYL
ncbi:MAG: ADP-ribosylation factor-like protein [Promethearchaeota archaeon]